MHTLSFGYIMYTHIAVWSKTKHQNQISRKITDLVVSEEGLQLLTKKKRNAQQSSWPHVIYQQHS